MAGFCLSQWQKEVGELVHSHTANNLRDHNANTILPAPTFSHMVVIHTYEKVCFVCLISQENCSEPFDRIHWESHSVSRTGPSAGLCKIPSLTDLPNFSGSPSPSHIFGEERLLFKCSHLCEGTMLTDDLQCRDRYFRLCHDFMVHDISHLWLYTEYLKMGTVLTSGLGNSSWSETVYWMNVWPLK